MKEIFEQIANAAHSGERVVLVTIIEVSGSVPRHVGSKMLVFADGKISGSIGGGKLELTAIAEAQIVLETGSAQKKSYQLTEEEGAMCGGRVELFFEPIVSGERLYIFGAGHIGQALASLASQTGFVITVIDNRPEFANRERLLSVEHIIAGEYAKILSQTKFTNKDFLVIVTHGHAHDEEILSYCIQQPFAYLGMIGSQRKVTVVLNKLRQHGLAPEILARVHSPIGLKIGAETPVEIAISILAEMIAVRHGVSVGELAKKLPLSAWQDQQR